MITLGTKAPLFSGLNQHNHTISLKDYKGKYVVLYFYPKDNTPGCTLEANDFQTRLPLFEAEKAVIIGVSKDSIKSHATFCEKFKLTFSLISDPDQDIIDAYEVWGEKKNYGKTYMGIIRTTYLIDTEGTIAAIWPHVKTKGHAQTVLDQVKLLNNKGL